MALVLEISGGALLAGALIAAFHCTAFEPTLRLWARALFVAAAIYVGFALVAHASTQWIFVEVGGLVLFAALAVLGLRYSPWVLAGAWLAHIAWDMGLHSQDAAFVPLWYPRACIGFDLVVSAYIVAMCIELRGRSTTALSRYRG